MIRTLLSVPAALRRFLAVRHRRALVPGAAALDFIGSDPAAKRLGSGGGTVSLLHAAWSAQPATRRPRLFDWIDAQSSLVLHAGGESRRLPAYAAIGKAFLPVPPLGGTLPRRFDQTLVDFQLPTYSEVLREAGPHAKILVASGDVWLDLDALQIPTLAADISGIGMRVAPEIARHFGVYFVAKSASAASARQQPIAFFLQKPSPAEIYRHLPRYDFFVDTGLWLFSSRAARLLFRRCGWNDRAQCFSTRDGLPSHLDLYTELGVALGTEARSNVTGTLRRIGWRKLATCVIPLDDARFFHLGSSRQLFESFDQIARQRAGETAAFVAATPSSRFMRSSALPVWLDGVGAGSLRVDGLNLASGIPSGARPIRLRQHHCVDIAPVDRKSYVFRPYALDDTLRGAADSGATICGIPAAEWLKVRGLPTGSPDIFTLPIYPIVSASDVGQELVDWYFDEKPDPALTARWRKMARLSAAAIPNRVNFARYFGDRRANQALGLLEEFRACEKDGDTRVFTQDFAAIARLCGEAPPLRTWLIRHQRALLSRLVRPEHRSRILVLIAQLDRGTRRVSSSRQAYTTLEAAIVSSAHLTPSRPRLALKEDQIVWARSPVRLDLAGGWTDTPPYCLEYGGAVLNVAALLNGQPPIQVFIRSLRQPLISLRSIDLGSSEIIRTDAVLAGFRDPRASFSLPKAALALAGFLGEFAAGRPAQTLRDRLRAFGGGLEISLLSAVPKGSGLGTSSILGAAVLAALNRACALGWDELSLYKRVLSMEQLLTTGGGWQDQAGALFRGVKLVQTAPGSAQTPSVRFLPGHLFDASHANHTLLLYYTGITRLAKGILKEIVGDMFLGRFETLQTLNLIRANALELFQALQQENITGLHRCIARSWALNKRLDAGTTTPEIERLLRLAGSDLAAAKLLGAGGGGYLLLCAKSAESGLHLREKFEKSPLNRRSRFIDFQLADRGLEVSVS